MDDTLPNQTNNASKTTPAQPTTLFQKIADLDAKRAAFLDEVRKKITRGKILVGAALIEAAKTDSRQEDFLWRVIEKAEPRDRAAIEIACDRVFKDKKKTGTPTEKL